ncbi:MAG: hypothetical protein WC359_05200 [Dehalococcoidia bacterium]|jgi:hypothetical protein
MPRRTNSAICKYIDIVEEKDLPYPKTGCRYVKIELEGFIVHRPISKTVTNPKKLSFLIALAGKDNSEHKIRLIFDKSNYFIVGFKAV